jgi:hypothetical protein
MRNRFYLACFRDNVGGNVAFHGKAGVGYTTDVEKAKTLTREEAQQAWEGAREYDLPISADHIDALTVSKVDSQVIPIESTFSKQHSEYLAYIKGKWAGNDVYWHSEQGDTLCVDHATRLSKDQAKLLSERYVVLPAALVVEKKRRTFAMSSFNKRTMVQGAGLVTPNHVKLEKRRKANPRVALNCPSCGRFAWQLHSMHFETCSNINCDENRLFNSN